MALSGTVILLLPIYCMARSLEPGGGGGVVIRIGDVNQHVPCTPISVTLLVNAKIVDYLEEHAHDMVQLSSRQVCSSQIPVIMVL